MKLRTRLSAALLTAAALSGQAFAEVAVESGWVRWLPPVSRMGSAYLILHNSGSKSERLLGIRSERAEKVELHRTETVDGMSRMVPQGPVEIPAGARLVMKPGDYHLMLHGLKQPLRLGERVRFTLEFEHQPPVSVALEVRKSPSAEMGAMQHEHAGKQIPGHSHTH